MLPSTTARSMRKRRKEVEAIFMVERVAQGQVRVKSENVSTIKGSIGPSQLKSAIVCTCARSNSF